MSPSKFPALLQRSLRPLKPPLLLPRALQLYNLLRLRLPPVPLVLLQAPLPPQCLRPRPAPHPLRDPLPALPLPSGLPLAPLLLSSQAPLLLRLPRLLVSSVLPPLLCLLCKREQVFVYEESIYEALDVMRRRCE